MVNFLNYVPLIMQMEKQECGIACIAMIAHYYDKSITLRDIRNSEDLSDVGITGMDIQRISSKYGLTCMSKISNTRNIHSTFLPAIAHMKQNHYVVITKITKKLIYIHDPAQGKISIKLNRYEELFSGAIFELWPKNKITNNHSNIKNILSIKTVLGNPINIYKYILKAFVLSVALEVISIILPMFSEWVFDLAIPSGDSDLLLTLAISFSFLLLLQQSFTFLRQFSLVNLIQKINFQWKITVFSKLLSLVPRFFSRNLFGEIFSRFDSIDNISEFYSKYWINTFIDGVMSIITLLMMFLYSWRLTLVSLISLSLYTIIRILRIFSLQSTAKLRINSRAKQENYFLETLRGINTIKIFQREQQRTAEWLELSKIEQKWNAQSTIQHLFYTILNSTLTGLERVWVIWWASKLIMSGNLTIGAMIAFLSFRDQVDKRFSNLVDMFCEIKSSKIHLDRISDIISSPQENDKSLQKLINLPCNTLKMSSISFTYNKSYPSVLKKIDLTVNRGESLAITGISGSGKTTLAKIMLGLHIPNSGTIHIDNIQVSLRETINLRNIISGVMQNDIIFNGSIKQNISFFSHNIDNKYLEYCCEIACIYNDIINMPDGINTVVGDDGCFLSGGQRQRILIARALYSKPKILLLDEATSNIDPLTELAIAKSINSLPIAKIIIAHRYETIAACDRFIQIDKGIINKYGSKNDFKEMVRNFNLKKV